MEASTQTDAPTYFLTEATEPPSHTTHHAKATIGAPTTSYRGPARDQSSDAFGETQGSRLIENLLWLTNVQIDGDSRTVQFLSEPSYDLDLAEVIGEEAAALSASDDPAQYAASSDTIPPVPREGDVADHLAPAFDAIAAAFPTPYSTDMERDTSDLALGGLSLLPPTRPPLTNLFNIVEQGVDVPFPPGGSFSVYDMKIRQHYVIPSDKVVVTRGSLDYCEYYAKYGTQTRYRFQLCHRHRAMRCSDGAMCHYIHATALPNATSVHVSENFATLSSVLTDALIRGGVNTHGYPTLPPGIDLDVYPPNCSAATPQRIPSHLILHTVGADRIFRWSQGGKSASKDIAPPRGRHCAHFQLKRLCNLGRECHFIHSLAPFVVGVSNTQKDPYAPLRTATV